MTSLPTPSTDLRTSTPTTSRGLCIIDDELRGFEGHPFEYARALYDAASRHDIDFVALSQKGLAGAPFPVLPVFEGRVDRGYLPVSERFRNQRFVRMFDIMASNLQFFFKILSACRGMQRRKWVFFLPNASHLQALGAGLFSLLQSGTEVVLCLRFNYFVRKPQPRWLPSAPLMRWQLRFLEALSRFRTIRLVADSEELAEEYSQLTRLPVEVCPIPHPEFVHRRAPRASSGPLRLGTAGGARLDKGFLILVDAVGMLVPQLRDGTFEIVVQCNHGQPAEPGVEDGVRRLRAWAETTPGLRLVENALDSEAYEQHLASLDVLLLPYDASVFHSRTSYVGAEGIALGKVLLTTRGTWIARQVEQFHAGLTFDDADPASLKAAILEVVERREDFVGHTSQRRQAWLACHNADALFEMVMG